jgi:ABC-2 type transport system ATP-binding protein
MVRVSVADGATAMLETVRTLDTAQLPPATLALREPTLDDVFLALTGHVAEESTDGERSSEQPRRARRRSA